MTPRIGQRANPGNPHLHPAATSLTAGELEKGLRGGDLDLVAGTAWLWAREQLARSVDVLFVDEAGQLSLADVLAIAHAAGTLALLGDPQQLAQPSDVAHPPGAGASALEHVLGEHATMPPAAGLLLDKTWRMHPDLCQFTSDTFYDGTADGGAGPGTAGDPRGQVCCAGPGCASWRCRTRGTPTPRRKRPAGWPCSCATCSAAAGVTGTGPSGRSGRRTSS